MSHTHTLNDKCHTFTHSKTSLENVLKIVTERHMHRETWIHKTNLFFILFFLNFYSIFYSIFFHFVHFYFFLYFSFSTVFTCPFFLLALLNSYKHRLRARPLSVALLKHASIYLSINPPWSNGSQSFRSRTWKAIFLWNKSTS